MARVNISTPDDVKSAMDEFPAVNWSAVATAAFAARIEEEKRKMEPNTIERLRKSKAAHIAAEEEKGKEAGAEAARGFLEYGQLVLLREIRDEIDQGVTFSCAEIAERLGEGVDYLFGDDEGADWSEFKVAGWVAGAVGVFDEIESKL